MTVSSIPIWLDCDPGHDDAFALLIALSPHFNLLGISTVYGNAPVEHTTYNTLALLTALNATNIKVYQGSSKPLFKSPIFATSIHGKSGLGDSSLLPSPSIRTDSSVDYITAMRNAILSYEHKIAIVATGTLTNVAKLFLAHPDLKDKVKYISHMGGAIEIGNWTPFAEFNTFCDPDAARLIFTDSELSEKCVLAPLNLTHQAIITKEVKSRLLYGDSANTDYTSDSKVPLIREIFHEFVTSFTQVYASKRGFLEGPPLHDPLAIAILLDLYGIENMDFVARRHKIDVIVSGEREGETVIVAENDERGLLIGESINVTKFWNVVLECFKSYD